VSSPALPLPAVKRSFTVVVAAAMASTALSIDIMLPAFSDIRADLELAPDAPEVSGLLTAFFLGLSVAQVPMGVLSDRFGRKPVLWFGSALFVTGAVLAAVSTTLSLMLVARFLWGVGAAGPRVVAIAMIRDVFEGASMARAMSFVMAIFIVVPILAPTVGAGIVRLGSWRAVFGFCALAGVALAAAATTLPETLAPARRRPMSFRPTVAAARSVVSEPRTLVHGLALTALFAVFAAYLGGVELIVGGVFGLDDWFPLIFGGVAVTMGLAVFLNGRFVEVVGLDRLIQATLLTYLAAAAALAVIAATTGGRPSFAVFVAPLVVVLCCHGLLIPNLNAAAMEPLGDAAGLGSALLGTVSTALGALIASRIDHAYDATVRPLTYAFVVAGVLALGVIGAGGRARRTAGSSPT
jgi:DHA1 family bicyclomycin/chloramphenicol resistance-like MFS transporter